MELTNQENDDADQRCAAVCSVIVNSELWRGSKRRVQNTLPEHTPPCLHDRTGAEGERVRDQ